MASRGQIVGLPGTSFVHGPYTITYSAGLSLDPFYGTRIEPLASHHLGGRIVELVKVHVVRSEARQRAVEGERNVPGLEVHPHAAVVEVASDLGREEHVVPYALERLPQDLFAVPPAVHGRGVDEVGAQLNGPPNRRDGFLVVR